MRIILNCIKVNIFLECLEYLISTPKVVGIEHFIILWDIISENYFSSRNIYFQDVLFFHVMKSS